MKIRKAILAIGISVCCVAFLVPHVELAAKVTDIHTSFKKIVAQDMNKEISVYSPEGNSFFGIVDEIGDDYLKLTLKGTSESRIAYIPLNSIRYIDRSNRFTTIMLR